MPALYGIIGYPLSHSFSPAYFNAKFAKQGIDAHYAPFPLSAISEFKTLLQQHPNLAGLSVTIPYKESIIPYLDELDATAREIGAVNCITIKNGKTKGCNTDVIGFRQSLEPILHQNTSTRALILGTGGSSKAVAYALSNNGIPYNKVSRTKTETGLTYGDITPEIIASHKLIVNTTPLGMFPIVDALPPLPYDRIGPDHILFDLIYNPAETLFLRCGRKEGATTKNGSEMLHLQAEASWQIWGH